MEFKSFGKIENIKNLRMTITQKIHGTNALVCVYEDNGKLELKCGSRTRWITPDDDNYGFARHVYDHKQEFIDKLGIGWHYGEWAGKGINSGEGLDCKNFYLFNHWKFGEKFKAQCENPELKLLPPNTYVVPILWNTFFDAIQGMPNTISNMAMSSLKRNGSSLYGAVGFDRPEGIVVQIGGQYWKKVFNPEETNWTKSPSKPKNDVQHDFDHLMQPIRLEKLFSRDEAYLREYPKSLGLIVKDYIKDLIEEQQCTEDEGKHVSRHIFQFVKQIVGENHDIIRAA